MMQERREERGLLTDVSPVCSIIRFPNGKAPLLTFCLSRHSLSLLGSVSFFSALHFTPTSSLIYFALTYYAPPSLRSQLFVLLDLPALTYLKIRGYLGFSSLSS